MYTHQGKTGQSLVDVGGFLADNAGTLASVSRRARARSSDRGDRGVGRRTRPTRRAVPRGQGPPSSSAPCGRRCSASTWRRSRASPRRACRGRRSSPRSGCRAATRPSAARHGGPWYGAGGGEAHRRLRRRGPARALPHRADRRGDALIASVVRGRRAVAVAGPPPPGSGTRCRPGATAFASSTRSSRVRSRTTPPCSPAGTR